MSIVAQAGFELGVILLCEPSRAWLAGVSYALLRPVIHIIIIFMSVIDNWNNGVCFQFLRALPPKTLNWYVIIYVLKDCSIHRRICFSV